jgi:hypothetical protein
MYTTSPHSFMLQEARRAFDVELELLPGGWHVYSHQWIYMAVYDDLGGALARSRASRDQHRDWAVSQIWFVRRAEGMSPRAIVLLSIMEEELTGYDYE